MADNEPVPTPTTPTPIHPNTNQVTTSDLKVKPLAESAQADRLLPGGASPANAPDPTNRAESGTGVEGEETIWEARYAMKNFLGRLLFRGALTIAWIALAVYTWGMSHANLQAVAIVTGLVLAVLWVVLGVRIIQARYGHYYRLTNRRLFVSTGLMNRRRDQVELIKVNDVFTRQTLVQRWLSLGTVVVVSSERALPMCYLLGVNEPKKVMDLVWHYARAERDHRSVMVDRV